MDCSPPGSSVPGISQTRILEWVAISFSRGSSQPRDQTQVSFFTSWATKRIHLAMQETRELHIWSLGQEDTLEQGMATQTRNLAWRIPWTEEPGGLQSMGSQRAGHDWVTNILITINSLTSFLSLASWTMYRNIFLYFSHSSNTAHCFQFLFTNNSEQEDLCA